MTGLPVDVLVGKRVRAARLAAGMTQTKLASKLGITFQQVQKYEKGATRLGASRLTEIAAAVGRPVASFFEGTDNAAAVVKGDAMFHLATAPGGLRLAQAFLAIDNMKLRAAIVTLVKHMSAERVAERDEATESITIPAWPSADI